jgi:SAM-dependent methyltransferase
MENRSTDILAQVADYYSAKLAEHGETPFGVDWNGVESQKLRFEQLSKVIDQSANFSLNDLGCGYGAMYEYLNSRYHGLDYNGCDVSADMIRAAQGRYVNTTNARFIVSAELPEMADYGVASGIFNVRLELNNAEWHDYMVETIGMLDSTSRRGFAFNCLTAYSDSDKMRDYLYYADPCALFDLCKRRYSRQVALLHDYGLYEFTIVVRKNP